MKFLPLAVLAAAVCLGVPAIANPVAPTPPLPTPGMVVQGTASVSQSGNLVTVQSSSGAIINWNSFSIPAGGTIHFAQPSASSVVLNRVNAIPSGVITGRLTSNGRVLLVSPDGTVVGPAGKSIPSGTLVARPLALSSAPVTAPVLTVAPTRGPLSVAVPVNSVRMVDGAVTLRMPLVAASPILFR